jgi:integrase
MASIDVKRDDNGRAVQYRARYRTPDGKSRGRNFTTLAKARAFLATVEHTKTTGGFVDPVAGRITVAAFVESWMALKVWSEGSRTRNEILWRLHVEPSVGALPLASVRRTHLQAVLNRSQLSPRTLVGLRGFMIAVFRAAERDRLISSSPAHELEIPAVEGGKAVALEPDQVAALVAAAPERYRALFAVTAATGLRLAEACGLTVGSVDFLRRTITVERQLITPAAGVPYLTTRLKTRASYRTIPVPSSVIDTLARHLEVYGAGPEGVIFTCVPNRGAHSGQAHFLPRGRVVEFTRTAARRAGVDATFHSLRHYAASRFLSHGVSVRAAADVLGHSPSVLLNTYAHFMAADEDRVRDVMADAVPTARVTGVSRADGR